MNKILIAVDDTKSAKEIFGKCSEMCKCMSPSEVNLVYVEMFEGRSLMDDMLGDAELSTLRNVLEGSEYKNTLDVKAHKILDYYKAAMEGNGCSAKIKKTVRSGHPADEIIKVAQESKADMIIIGSRGKNVSKMFMGSVSREVANNAEIPVLIMR
ncbi:MAG: universal stress protein [Proteobacteria bacterium]|nr:universal stress protein [Pseudomonadota bacterium]MBU1710306.1 universal stress protein [Pseudomonadota bacterium]